MSHVLTSADGKTWTADKEFHFLSLGAGVQSTRLILEFDEGAILHPVTGKPIELAAAFFADTQDEPQKVYKHLEWIERRVTRFPVIRLTKGRLSEHLRVGVNSTGQRFASIPAYTIGAGDASEGRTRRQCSREYKIELIDRACRQHCGVPSGRAVPKGMRIVQHIGISMDEAGRAVRVLRNRVPKRYREEAKKWNYARLLEFFSTRRWAFQFSLVDRFVTRARCLDYLKPRVPHKVPRSACVFCPFHDDIEWNDIRQDHEDWALAVDVDRALRVEGNIVNRNMDKQLFLHRSCQPLELVQLDTRPDPRKAQQGLNFNAECLGVCGV